MENIFKYRTFSAMGKMQQTITNAIRLGQLPSLLFYYFSQL